MEAYRRSWDIVNNALPATTLFRRGHGSVAAAVNRSGGGNVVPGNGFGTGMGLSGHGNSKDRVTRLIC